MRSGLCSITTYTSTPLLPTALYLYLYYSATPYNIIITYTSPTYCTIRNYLYYCSHLSYLTSLYPYLSYLSYHYYSTPILPTALYPLPLLPLLPLLLHYRLHLSYLLHLPLLPLLLHYRLHLSYIPLTSLTSLTTITPLPLLPTALYPLSLLPLLPLLLHYRLHLSYILHYTPLPHTPYLSYLITAHTSPTYLLTIPLTSITSITYTSLSYLYCILYA